MNEQEMLLIFDGDVLTTFFTWLLIVTLLAGVDMLTKWVAIAQKYCIDHQIPITLWSIFRAIFARAWIAGYLETKMMKEKVTRKTLMYFPLCLVVVVLSMLPAKAVFGASPRDVVCMIVGGFLIFAELFSIVENLKVGGFDRVGLLQDAVGAAARKFLGMNGGVPKAAPRDVPENERIKAR